MNFIINNTMQKLPITDIIKKFKTKSDRINFMRENSKLYI